MQEEFQSKILQKLSGQEERILNLEEYQKKQNGHLADLNRKMDAVFCGIIAILGSIAGGAILLLLQNGG